MALSDAVAAQIMGELHVLTKNIESQAQRVEELATTVVVAAKRINTGKAVLHSQSEALLIQRVNEITKAIGELKGMESAIQGAARTQAEIAISPIVEALKNRDHLSVQYYKKASDVYETLSNKVVYTSTILATVFLITMGGAFYLGMKIGSSSTDKAKSHAVNPSDKRSEAKPYRGVFIPVETDEYENFS